MKTREFSNEFRARMGFETHDYSSLELRRDEIKKSDLALTKPEKPKTNEKN